MTLASILPFKRDQAPGRKDGGDTPSQPQSLEIRGRTSLSAGVLTFLALDQRSHRSHSTMGASESFIE